MIKKKLIEIKFSEISLNYDRRETTTKEKIYFKFCIKTHYKINTWSDSKTFI